MIENLTAPSEEIRRNFEKIDEVRESAYKISREITKTCANGIRAVHRSEWDVAESLITDARKMVQSLITATEAFSQIYWAGYTQDCLKEYVEAEHTLALIRGLPIQGPRELNVSDAAWLNGLAEAASELRRRILDILRHGHAEEAEQLLDQMDEIYSLMVTFDFRDAITGGLRRRTDQLRAVLERTRGDITTSIRQSDLTRALEAMEQKLGGDAG
ncbi:MAG: haloacid dehalogenase [Chloroflexota bacterium]